MRLIARYLLFLCLPLAIIMSISLCLHKKPEHPTLHPASKKPDQFMIGVTATKFGETGALHSRLTSPDIRHYPQDNTALVLQPNITVFQDTSPPWHITAKRAQASHGLQVIHLYDNVKMHQAAGADNQETTLLTQAMTFYPDRRFAETQKPVTLLQPHNRVDTVGMEVNMADGWVKLLSQARGVYSPENP